MAHNPIVKQTMLARMEQPQIGRNQVAFLYAGGRLFRQMKTGETLGWSDLLKGGLQLVLVDLTPHQMRWNARFRTSEPRDFFNLAVDLTYRVQDPQQIAENNITNTESAILRTLDPEMRREASRYALTEHQDAELAFEQLITRSLFDTNGLELIKADVRINMTDEDFARVSAIISSQREFEVERQLEYQTELPSKTPAYKYEANVIIGFQVVDRTRLPPGTLDKASEWLWKRVRPRLRRTSRRYQVNQLIEVDDALLDELEADLFSAHGLEITFAEIEIQPDSTSLKHAEELAQMDRDMILVQKRHILAAIEQDHQLSAEAKYVKHYGPMIENNEWNLLAVALGENKKDIPEIMGYLDDRRQEQLKMQLTLIGVAAEKDGLGPDLAEQLIGHAASNIARTSRLIDQGDRLLQAQSKEPESTDEGADKAQTTQPKAPKDDDVTPLDEMGASAEGAATDELWPGMS